MTESRTELLTWLNDLLKLNYAKIEQCGSGAAYCQIFDSIYGDVPLNRVKFNARLDYEHIHNYKMLQAGFNNHGISKIVPVERLIKCKYQDNLDFLQWMKKYWDTYYPGGSYDSVARRGKGETEVKKMHIKKDSESAGRGSSRPPARPALPAKDGTPTTNIRGGGQHNRLHTEPPMPVADTDVYSASNGTKSSTVNTPQPVNPRHAWRQDAGEEQISPVVPVASLSETHIGFRAAAQVDSESASSAKSVHKRVASNPAGPVQQRTGAVNGTAFQLRTRTPSINPDCVSVSREEWHAQQTKMIALRMENAELKRQLEDVRCYAVGVERERNFYFGKLRDIEIVIRQKIDKIQIDRAILPLLTSIQGIMYRTEDGFISLKQAAGSNAFPIANPLEHASMAQDVEASFSDNILHALAGSGTSMHVQQHTPLQQAFQTQHSGHTFAPVTGIPINPTPTPAPKASSSPPATARPSSHQDDFNTHAEFRQASQPGSAKRPGTATSSSRIHADLPPRPNSAEVHARTEVTAGAAARSASASGRLAQTTTEPPMARAQVVEAGAGPAVAAHDEPMVNLPDHISLSLKDIVSDSMDSRFVNADEGEEDEAFELDAGGANLMDETPPDDMADASQGDELAGPSSTAASEAGRQGILEGNRAASQDGMNVENEVVNDGEVENDGDTEEENGIGFLAS